MYHLETKKEKEISRKQAENEIYKKFRIDAAGTLYVIPPYAKVMREENSSWHNIQEKSLNSTNIYMYYSSPSCRLVII